MGQIIKGSQSIDFTGEDFLGQGVHLSQFSGKKVVLSFFRGASCPFCNLRVHQLINRYTDFQSEGIEIIAVFAATKDEIKKYAGNQKPPFPIVADPKRVLYQLYDIEQSSIGLIRSMLKPIKMINVMFSGFFTLKSMKEAPILPADFLINEDQTIHRVYYGKDFGDHIPIEEVISWQTK